MRTFPPFVVRVGALGVAMLGAFGALAAAFASAQAAAAPQGQAVSITADRQSTDLSGATQFSGNVKVAYRDLRLSGALGQVQADGKGQPSVATFVNRPKGARLVPGGGQDHLEADVIRIFLNENRVVAQGQAYTTVTSIAAAPVSIRADQQEFDNAAKVVRASGNVQVNYQDTVINSPHATMNTAGGKAKKVVFTGGVRAAKQENVITSDRLTILTDSNNLLAENNVKTDVKSQAGGDNPSGRVVIMSDFQQYDKASDTMLASGNVRITYGDYRARGPKATFRLKSGQVDKVFLTGRASIIGDGRQVEADKIVITTNPRHFDATGNVRSKFLARETPAAAPAKPAAGAKKPLAPGKPGAPGVKPYPPGASPSDDYLE